MVLWAELTNTKAGKSSGTASVLSTKGCSTGSCFHNLHLSGWACQGLHCTFGNLVPAWDQRTSLHSAISAPADLVNPPSAFTTETCYGKQMSMALVKQPQSCSFCQWGCWPLQSCLAQCHSKKQRMVADVLYFSKVRAAFSFEASEHLFHPKPQSCSVFPAWLRIYFLSYKYLCKSL